MKEHKKLKIFGIIVGAIVAFFLIINIIPPAKAIQDNPFLKGKDEKTMLAAHRGGAATNPENTMLAYKEAVNTYHVDILESDLYLTKDGYLVYNHDSYVDETCNINGDVTFDEVKELIKDKSKRHYIEDLTLEELRTYNFGYYFETKDNQRPYNNLTGQEVVERGLQIVEVSELFATFYETNPDLMFIVEIKDSNERGYEAVDKLIAALEAFPNYKDQIVIGTFNGEIEDYLRENYPSLLRGASEKGATIFVATQIFKVNIFDTNDFACLQIPMQRSVKGIKLELNKKTYINRAHRRNIAVQYWTINDEDEMKELIDLGCDAIMSDDLEVARRVIDTYNPK